nr:MCE family protein [Solirubrobacterales bacterium]
MIRGLLLVLVLGVATVGAVVLSSGGDELPEYKVVLDNSFGLTEGADLRSAGVAIGSIESLDVERETNHAIVTVGVSEPAFADFRTDVFCQVQPQSLIGEYFLDCRPGSEEERLPSGGTIPVEQTAGTI